MVSIELLRTHMHFDGLGNVFRALGFEAIAREVEERQRPDGGMDGAGVSDMYIQMARGLTGTWGGRRPQ